MNKVSFNLDDWKVDFNKVQQDKPGTWPLPLKLGAWLAIVVLVVAGGNYLILNDQRAELATKQADEQTLREEFEKKAFQAKNLDELRAQMKQATETLGALLKQLPAQTEVPGLLEDVTRTGLGSGLEFSEIKLLPEKNAQFYIELPISVKVTGGYHDFATFVSGISALSRIVTLHNFKIDLPVGAKTDASPLTMQITAKTYRSNTTEADAELLKDLGAASPPPATPSAAAGAAGQAPKEGGK